MTRNDEFNAAETVMQMILDNGMDGLAEAVRILLNEAMKIERLERRRMSGRTSGAGTPTVLSRRPSRRGLDR